MRAVRGGRCRDIVPLRDSVADVVLSVFAPRPGQELARVVRPGGEFVAAFAAPRHLERLRDRWGLLGVREQKLEELTTRLEPWFEPVSTDAVEYEVELTEEDAQRVVLMGPNARHGHELERLDGPIVDHVSAIVARFRRVQARGTATAITLTAVAEVTAGAWPPAPPSLGG